MNKLVINNQQLSGLVSKICRDIVISGWRPDYIVGLSRGGLTPAVMISHYLNVPMYTLNVSLRDSNTGPESNLWMAEDALGHTDKTIDPMLDDPMSLLQEGRAKDILIVDDINDTGATFNWIMKDWPSGCFPEDPTWENEVWNQNVKFAVLVDNLASRCTANMDFVGMEINKAEKDVWVDFPWEDWWTK
jgi:hypoxanthine phosphoribosyltransferase